MSASRRINPISGLRERYAVAKLMINFWICKKNLAGHLKVLPLRGIEWDEIDLPLGFTEG